jgi:Tfp pilus assembly PilM family ATPase
VEVPPGLIQPSLKDPNIKDGKALGDLLRNLCAQSGCRGWVRVALPDPVFALRSLATDELPAKREEALQFLRWQMRNQLPFPVEEARLDFLSRVGPDGRHRAICLVARDRVLAEYEQALAMAGLRAAVLDGRSICLAQATSEQLGQGGVVLLAVARRQTTFLLFVDGVPRFWRILPQGRPAWADGERARLFDEVGVSVSFCRESEGLARLDRVILSGLGPLTAQISSALAEWLEIPVLALAPGSAENAAGDGKGATEDADLWWPAVGAAIRPW